MRIGGAAWVVLALAAGALVWLVLAFQRDLQSHRERVANGSRMVQTRCGPVELAEAGQGPPLLVVHGTGGGFDQGMALGKDFAARGLRVLAPSRFGYLRTPYPANASAEAQADQFACLLDALGIERVAIIGVSAGANSAMQFAIRHPQRTSALLLLVPAAYQPKDPPAVAPRTMSASEKLLMRIVTSDFVFWAAKTLARDAAIRLVLATPPEVFHAADAAERARANQVLDQIMPIGARIQGLLNDARLASDPPRYALESIRAPTLAISQRDDLYGTYGSAQYTTQQVTRARFVGYESGGHAWLGHHREILDQVVDFVRASR